MEGNNWRAPLSKSSLENDNTLKKEGGLGVRHLISWNKATSMRLVWLLFFSLGSIWVAWFVDTILSGDLSNFWIIKESNKHSWMVKRLLKLRPLVYNWIHLNIENGRSTRFWSDNWSLFGRISTYLNLRSSSRLGIPQQATIADLFRNGSWRLPPARSEEQVLLHITMTSIALNDQEDKYEWRVNDKASESYSTREVYNELKHHVEDVSWFDIVWICQGYRNTISIPGWWSSIVLPPETVCWIEGFSTDPACLLCNSVPESRDHLYFCCSYSWSIWSELASRCSFTPSQQWDQSINDLQSSQGPRHARLLIILVWQAIMYFLWMERNNRLHRQTLQAPWLNQSSYRSNHQNKDRRDSPLLSSALIFPLRSLEFLSLLNSFSASPNIFHSTKTSCLWG